MLVASAPETYYRMARTGEQDTQECIDIAVHIGSVEAQPLATDAGRTISHRQNLTYGAPSYKCQNATALSRSSIGVVNQAKAATILIDDRSGDSPVRLPISIHSGRAESTFKRDIENARRAI